MWCAGGAQKERKRHTSLKYKQESSNTKAQGAGNKGKKHTTMEFVLGRLGQPSLARDEKSDPASRGQSVVPWEHPLGKRSASGKKESPMGRRSVFGEMGKSSRPARQCCMEHGMEGWRLLFPCYFFPPGGMLVVPMLLIPT